jgi:hypothetical protein
MLAVIPYDTHSPTKLLNYLTAPDCVIYTAGTPPSRVLQTLLTLRIPVIASAAVPGILNPVVLMTKTKDGVVHPWEFQGKHKDGSLRVDIPLRMSLPLPPFLQPSIDAHIVPESLHLLYNVNFSIVSQVNRPSHLPPLRCPLTPLAAHIHLFHFAPRGAPGRPVSHRKGKGWRGGFFLSAAEQLLKLELTKNFRVSSTVAS